MHSHTQAHPAASGRLPGGHPASTPFPQQQPMASLHHQQQIQHQQRQHQMQAAAAMHQQQHQPHPAHFTQPPQLAHPQAYPASSHPRAPLTNISLPKQQVTCVLNSMTAGGTQLQKMDGHDLANIHMMNARYLQQIASQRGMHQQPHRRPDMPAPSAALFTAKM